MASIQLTRAAIVDAKRLDRYHQDRLPDFLDNLHQYVEKKSCRFNLKHLSGKHLGLSRLRHGDEKLRLLCKLNAQDSSVIAIRLRNDSTYTENYSHLPFAPCYSWNGEREEAWLNWLYGGYSLCPTITSEQKEDTQLIDSQHLGQWQSRRENWVGSDYRDRLAFSFSLIQSPPGTGKTITAVLQACHYYKQGWNICLILPDFLLKEVQRSHAICNLDRSLDNQFFMGTFQSWLHQLWAEGEIQPATAEQELQAFQQVAQNRNTPRNRQALTPRDVILYQAFVLEPSQTNFSKMPVYQQNQKRIEQLEQQVNPSQWRQALSGYLCRWDTAQHLKENPPLPLFPGLPKAMGTIIILDEAQDYLLSELDSIKNLCQDWTTRQNHYTILWLLGDLNQRIQPVDFTWSKLKLARVVGQDWQIYRNTQSILKFANPFLEWGQTQTRMIGVRWDEVPAPPSSDRGYAKGEPVRLLVCATESDAWIFLDRLQQTVSASCSDTGEESLLRQLAQQVRVLVPRTLQIDESLRTATHQVLEFLTVDQVKGREFESSIVFRLFVGESLPDLEQAYRWYTLLTRTRSRLLVITTASELEDISQRIGIPDSRDPFADCQRIEPTDALAIAETIDWLIAVVSNADIAERPEYVSHRWLEQWCNSRSLNLSAEAAEIYQQLFIYLSPIQMLTFERDAIQRLRTHSLPSLQEQLETARQRVHLPLCCLLLRTMHRSWDAVEMAKLLQESHPNLYQHILNGIAADLEQCGLRYEAMRVKQPIERFATENYPYPELLERCGALFPLLYELLQNRFATCV